jgi:hypothetical protein
MAPGAASRKTSHVNTDANKKVEWKESAREGGEEAVLKLLSQDAFRRRKRWVFKRLCGLIAFIYA